MAQPEAFQFAVPPPDQFRLHYNGYTFSEVYTETTQLAIRPVYDRAGRTVTHVEYLLGVRTYLRSARPTDREVIDIREKLTKAGGRLYYAGRGVGTLEVNLDIFSRDVVWGPKPREIAMRVMEGTCIHLDWQVEWAARECDCLTYLVTGQRVPPALELTFAVEHRPRRNGRVDRAVSGELRIANNRATPDERAVLLSADRYREQVAAPVPHGFDREWGPWRLSEDRSRLSFSWVDKEFDQSVPPPGVVAARASQTTRSTDRGLLRHQVTIQAEYELAATAPARVAEQAFARLVSRRMGRIPELAGADGKKTPGYVVVGYQATEPDLYGDLKAGFSLTYEVVDTSLDELLERTGFWVRTTPGPGDGWADWAASLKADALNPYGYRQIVFRPEADWVVDGCAACDRPQPEPPPVEAKTVPLGGGLEVPYPSLATSWMEYTNAVRVEADSGAVEFRSVGTLPPAPAYDQPPAGPSPPPPPPADGYAPGGGLGVVLASDRLGGPRATAPLVPARPAGGFTLPAAAKAADDFAAVAGSRGKPGVPTGTQQVRAPAAVYLFLEGEAIRAGYPVPCPELVSVDGQKPLPANRLDSGEGFVSGVIFHAGVPVYGARWRLRYYLPVVPQGPLAPPPNPLLGDVR